MVRVHDPLLFVGVTDGPSTASEAAVSNSIAVLCMYRRGLSTLGQETRNMTDGSKEAKILR